MTTAILVATKTFTIKEMGEFIQAGVEGVHGTAALFIFSVLFFGIMTDAGMFDKIIGKLMKKVGSNVIGVAVMTCLIAMIAHLDGAGAATFLITVPAMLPVYKKLGMRPTTLMLICVSAMGVMNLLPWGGPTMRAATVLGIEPNKLWLQILPMQIVGIIIALATAFIWGTIEKRRGAGTEEVMAKAALEIQEEEKETGVNESDLARPQNFIFNLILTLLFDTDSFFFGLMPILISIAGEFGVEAAHIAIVMVVCRNCATSISPVVPATFLGIGLAGVEIKDHIKRCFFWIWGVSIICLISGLILGVIKL